MRTSKSTPEQMVHILRQGDSGVPVGELCRQHGISEQTFYRWKKRFGDLGQSRPVLLLNDRAGLLAYPDRDGFEANQWRW